MACARVDVPPPKRPAPAKAPDTITVFDAGSLALPLRAALDSFALRAHVRIEQEHAGSLETVRKLTELGRTPDVIALADAELFPKLLIPRYVASYIPFARNRMIVAYTEGSRFSTDLRTRPWYEILTRPGIAVGRSDPNLDPAGYRALLVFQLAERYYKRPGLARQLERNADPRYIRPKSADLVALLQTGHLDYAWTYESVARAAGLQFVELPTAIDLGTPADSTAYAAAMVRVRGASKDTLTVHGAPILYGIATPRTPPHGDIGARFVTFVTSPEGQRILRSRYLTPVP